MERHNMVWKHQSNYNWLCKAEGRRNVSRMLKVLCLVLSLKRNNSMVQQADLLLVYRHAIQSNLSQQEAASGLHYISYAEQIQKKHNAEVM